ncbi:MAG: O-antigen ligase family protein, partial [Microgenomates group bacterium]
NIWVQDVQNRVFSSLGQPNWLAAWIVLIFFLPFSAFNNPKTKTFSIYIFTLTYFLVLLFTKSRSGILGFSLSWLVFWALAFISKEKQNQIYNLKNFFYLTGLILAIAFTIGTPWTPSLKNLLSKKENVQIQTTGTVLETGGTESGEIRKIVWKGAFNIWKDYPIFGSGPETFALSYFKYKPQQHNLTSEWNYIYNKAHNEYLNYLANTGLIGAVSYLTLIASSLLIIFRNSLPRKNKKEKAKIEQISLLAGYSGFLVTNIFGFSVVPTSLLFFLYPAISFSLNNNMTKKENKNENINFILILPLIFFITTSYFIIRYWQADFYYNQGKIQNTSKNYALARNYLTKAIKLNPYEPSFVNELSKSIFSLGINTLGINTYNKGDEKTAQQLISQSLDQAKQAISMSP